MKHSTLSAIALVCLLAAPATADLRHGRSWLQGSGSAGFAFASVDIDDESGEVSVLADFQGLSSPLTGGRLVGPSGELLCTLSPQVNGATGIAHGSATLSPADQWKVISGETDVVLDTQLHPRGEIDGPVTVNLVSYNFPITTAQLSPAPASTANGIGYVFEGVTGNAAFSGQLTGLQGAVTSIEIHRSAWYGQAGKLFAPVTLIGHPNPSLVTYSLSLPPLTAEEHRDLHDGLCYVIVRTSLFPDGELRGQIRAPTLGDAYCDGRPNSTTILGARVAFEGAPFATASSMRLTGTNLPPGKIVLPILGFGSSQTFAPGGLGGILCVGGAGIGRLGAQAGLASAQGIFDTTLDLSTFSAGGSVHTLQPGMRLNFQLWYRDPQGPTATNFSSAVSVVFH